MSLLTTPTDPNRFVGKFLLQGELVNQYFSAGYKAIEKKMVDIALQEYGYRILPDDNFEDEASCHQEVGAHWMTYAGKDHCMRLAYRSGSDYEFWPATESVIKAIEEKNDIHLRGYFTSACDCSINGSGEPDTDNLPVDGSVPRCFYNIQCQSAEICRKLMLS